MARFVGRTKELDALRAELGRVASEVATRKPGRCLFIRGRRRVGKSRMIEEFIDAAGVPALFFTASGQGDREFEIFSREAADSSLPHAHVFSGVTPRDWDGCLGLLASALDEHEPSVVVIDEFPYLVGDSASTEASFQKYWDRHLSSKAVLFILVGSDLAMMETLNTHGRPLFQRGTDMVVPPLSPSEVGSIIKARTAADAFDAYLLTGGMPMLCDEWPRGKGAEAYLTAAVGSAASMFVTGAIRVLEAEFPTEAQARDVLSAIGTGERTFTNIARSAGGLQHASLNRSLDILVAKRIVTKELPLSTTPSREARYRVSDPYLQFWLRFIGPHLSEIDRGRGDLIVKRFKTNWSTWRGKAVEPIVREALFRLAPFGSIDANTVGGYWTRSNRLEVDLIGADRSPIAQKITFAGSIKWRDTQPFDQNDLTELVGQTSGVPGVDATTPLVVVSRCGTTTKGVAASFDPEDLLAAWP